MRQGERRPLGRGRTAGTGRVEEARTGSPKPQWRGLFREPDWPPEDDED